VAKAPLIFYLDADDFLQPAALDVYYKVQQTYGGWVYSDWFNQNMEVKVANDWDAFGLRRKMLGPMTGLYPRDAVTKVLFEDFGGWEDWDIQLSLLELGVCGTHIEAPLFVYRYHTGTRREDNYAKSSNLLEYIKEKHSVLYEENFMANCRKCGGGGGRPKVTVSRGSAQKVQGEKNDLVLMEYIGPATQFHGVSSKVKKAIRYEYGGEIGAETRKFFVLKQDAEWMKLNSHYRVVPDAVQQTSSPDDLPVLESYARPIQIEEPQVIETFTPVSKLNIAPEVITILENGGFTSVESLVPMGVAQLVTIKGIGPARAAQVMNAVTEVLRAR
jgi:hypothetical protein